MFQGASMRASSWLVGRGPWVEFLRPKSAVETGESPMATSKLRGAPLHVAEPP